MIEIKIVSDLEEAKKLWNLLSPEETIYDLWDFRYCFYKYENCRLEFITAYNDGTPVAVLPLQYNYKDECYECFAEEFMEESRPFIKKGFEYLIPDLYKEVKPLAKLYDISADSDTDEFTKKFELEDYTYFLPLEKYNDFYDFLNDRLNAKRKRSLIKELKEIEDKKVTMEIFKPENFNKKNKLNDTDSLNQLTKLLFDLNFLSFAKESYLQKINERKAHHDLFSLNLEWRLIILSINGKREAISFSILYKNVWYYLITGVNFKNYPGLGKYLVKINIEEAIKEGLKIYDCGLGDCGWKHLWHFNKKEQYLLIKK